MDNFDLTQITGHGLSVLAIAGSLMGWFPALAALAAFVWYMIQIWASAPVQSWLHTRRLRKMAALKKDLARLEAIQARQDHEAKHHRD